MYILDTNVVSELRKGKKAYPNVTTWVAGTDVDSMFISVVSIMEIDIGIRRLVKDATQQEMLRQWFQGNVLTSFEGKILPINTDVALICASLHVPDAKSDRDAWIAATALVHGMTVVTRNTSDFIHTGIKLINPWEKL
jgi:toxin FitB